jgi:hypothetical protein
MAIALPNVTSGHLPTNWQEQHGCQEAHPGAATVSPSLRVLLHTLTLIFDKATPSQVEYYIVFQYSYRP